MEFEQQNQNVVNFIPLSYSGKENQNRLRDFLFHKTISNKLFKELCLYLNCFTDLQVTTLELEQRLNTLGETSNSSLVQLDVSVRSGRNGYGPRD